MIKNTFGWMPHINTKKTPIDEFSDEDWDMFNSYVIHRVLSMNPDYLELVNEVQTILPQNKKEIYSIYKEFIPKNNKWSKYIKSTTKTKSKELIGYLKDYWECSNREALEYYNLLDKSEIVSILNSIGLNKKDIKQLLK
jgi:hypothetical protein|tara:strand:+ start:751 stop:1167 length:417 start_codon:yes stop_codon:yes gene_type:complete